MKRLLPIALALLALAAGCTKERVAEVGDGGRPGASSDYTCLTCHANADSIKAYMAPEGLRLAAAASLAPRGDG